MLKIQPRPSLSFTAIILMAKSIPVRVETKGIVLAVWPEEEHG